MADIRLEIRSKTNVAVGPGQKHPERLKITSAPDGKIVADLPKTEELHIRSGPRFNLRTKKGLAERLELGTAIHVNTNNYELLMNKPQINGVELIGNKTSKQLKIKETEPLTNLEIESMIQSVFG